MKILGVTACPSGVAHTYMAAEALERAAKALGHDVKVETQGSIGIENKITRDEIMAADAVVLTKDMQVKGIERFKDILTVKVGISDVIKKSEAIVKKIESHISK